MSPQQEARLAEALRHVEMGFWVLPCWSTDAKGTCKCGQSHAGREQSIGKHPYSSVKNGFRDATNDPERVRKLLSAASEPNYGIVWPEDSPNGVVLEWDVDGADWKSKIKTLKAQYGPLPPTKTTRSPSGGLHIFYRWPDGLPVPDGNHFHGFVVRWPWKGYVIGPGSRINGAVYADVGTPDIALLPLSWAVTEPVPGSKQPLISVSGLSEGYELPESIATGSRHDEITRFVASRWNRGISKAEIEAAVRSVLVPLMDEAPTDEKVRYDIDEAWDTAVRGWGEPGSRPGTKTKEQRQQASKAKGPFVVKPFAAYRHLQMQWAWDDWLPRGVVTLLDGNPGVGKSNIVLDLIARASRQTPWPDGSTAAPRALKAIYITREDDPATTLGPRLAAAGGDPDLVFFLEAEMVLPDDAERLRELCVREQPDIVVIDPIFSHISADVKTISDNDARVNVMNPLSVIADEVGCVMLILRHFNKQVGSTALNRGAGSLGGFVGAARQVLAVTHDPDSDEDHPLKVFGVVKSNYGPTNVAMKYAIEGHLLPGWTKTVSRIRWEGISRLSVDDILRDANPDRSKGAAEALRDVMAGAGFKMKPSAVIAAMKSRGFGRAAVYNAAKRLGIDQRREGFPSTTVWRLVPDEAAAIEADDGDDEETPPDAPPSEPRSCLLPAEHPKQMTAFGVYACPTCQPSKFSTKDDDDASRNDD